MVRVFIFEGVEIERDDRSGLVSPLFRSIPEQRPGIERKTTGPSTRMADVRWKNPSEVESLYLHRRLDDKSSNSRVVVRWLIISQPLESIIPSLLADSLFK